jgi:hypothetical protein
MAAVQGCDCHNSHASTKETPTCRLKPTCGGTARAICVPTVDADAAAAVVARWMAATAPPLTRPVLAARVGPAAVLEPAAATTAVAATKAAAGPGSVVVES